MVVRFREILVALVLAILLGASVQADEAEEAPNLEVGIAAHEAGDYRTAIINLAPLAIEGSAEAQFRMAKMHVRGHGVSNNGCYAVVWADKAARQNHPEAAYFMSFMYFGGGSMKSDLEMAYRWAAHSAILGHHDGVKLQEAMATGLTPERRSALDEEMKTWDATKQPAVEIFPFAEPEGPLSGVFIMMYEGMSLLGC